MDPFIYRISVYKGKKEAYFTFCTPECRKEIDSYFAFREQYGEQITPESPLLRTEINTRIPDMTRIIKPRDMSKLRGLIHALIHKSNVFGKQTLSETGKIERNEVMGTHGLRKYFETTSTLAGLNPLYVEMLMGHKIGLKGHYFKPTETDLLMGNDKMLGYKSAINDLTINEENRLKYINKKLEIERDQIKEMEQLHKMEMLQFQKTMEEKFNELLSMVDVAKVK